MDKAEFDKLNTEDKIKRILKMCHYSKEQSDQFFAMRVMLYTLGDITGLFPAENVNALYETQFKYTRTAKEFIEKAFPILMEGE